MNQDERQPQPEHEQEKLNATTTADVSADEAEIKTSEEAEAGEQVVGEPSLEERLEAAEAQAAEYLEGWQRARAEFANARKRFEKDRIDARRNATAEVISKLLPVLDDFDRALENVPAEIAEDDWFEGVSLVHRKLTHILESANIERIEAVGQPFDPNFHEAVSQEESDEHESGVVIKELQPGYKLNDRVIRPAMVVVAA